MGMLWKYYTGGGDRETDGPNPPTRPPRRLLWWRRSEEERRQLREYKLWRYALYRLGYRRVAWDIEPHVHEDGERTLRMTSIVMYD